MTRRGVSWTVAFILVMQLRAVAEETRSNATDFTRVRPLKHMAARGEVHREPATSPDAY
jgi:hypothetical protein